MGEYHDYRIHGGLLLANDAIRAKCFQCQERYTKGLYDCESPECPLYPYMPYKGLLMSEGFKP